MYVPCRIRGLTSLSAPSSEWFAKGTSLVIISRSAKTILKSNIHTHHLSMSECGLTDETKARAMKSCFHGSMFCNSSAEIGAFVDKVLDQGPL